MNKRYKYHINKFITQAEFDKLMNDRRNGTTTLTISRIVARQFFTHIGRGSIEAVTGQSVSAKKTYIWFTVIVAPLLFLSSMGVIYMQYGATYASLLVPASAIFWVIIFGLTSNHGGWAVGNVPLFLSLVLLVANQVSFALPLMLLTLSIWLQRSAYLLSAVWLQNIVASSYAAYEVLLEHIEITSFKEDA